MDQMVIPPRFWPRDAKDALIAATFGVVQTSVLFVLPACILGVAVGITTRSCGLAVLTGAGTFIAIYGTWLSLTVWSATVDRVGVHFRRLLGKPKTLAWDRVVSVAPAPRRELILQGWLWPPFPAREMTPSLTSVGHYRIAWESGFCFYPPADAAQFESAIRSFMHGAA